MKQVTYSVLVRKTRAAINPNVLYTTKQAASFLNLSVSRLRDLVYVAHLCIYREV